MSESRGSPLFWCASVNVTQYVFVFRWLCMFAQCSSPNQPLSQSQKETCFIQSKKKNQSSLIFFKFGKCSISADSLLLSLFKSALWTGSASWFEYSLLLWHQCGFPAGAVTSQPDHVYCPPLWRIDDVSLCVCVCVLCVCKMVPESLRDKCKTPFVIANSCWLHLFRGFLPQHHQYIFPCSTSFCMCPCLVWSDCIWFD